MRILTEDDADVVAIFKRFGNIILSDRWWHTGYEQDGRKEMRMRFFRQSRCFFGRMAHERRCAAVTKVFCGTEIRRTFMRSENKVY